MSSRLSRLAGRLSGGPRLILAVLLLAVGAVSAIASATPTATVPVVVTARSLTPGATVQTADVRLEQRPTAERPSVALGSTSDAVGHRVVGALGTGEILTSTRLAPGGFTSGLAAGRNAVAVGVPTALVTAIAAGDVVDVVVGAHASSGSDLTDDMSATDPGATVDLAESARVLAVWPAQEGEDSATIVVDVSRSEARRLATLAPETLVGMILVGP